MVLMRMAEDEVSVDYIVPPVSSVSAPDIFLAECYRLHYRPRFHLPEASLHSSRCVSKDFLPQKTPINDADGHSLSTFSRILKAAQPELMLLNWPNRFVTSSSSRLNAV